MSKVLSYYTSSLPYCCGAHEVGEMAVHEDSSSASGYGRQKVEIDQAIRKILSSAEGRPVFFNFVQCSLDDEDDDEPSGEFEDEYNAYEFMDLVAAHPRVIDLGTWINPGTGNRIHGFMIQGNNHE